MREFSPFHWMVVLIAGFLYFLPAFVGRKKKNAGAIFWLNFLLGWTVAGWLVVLIWGLTKDHLVAHVIDNHPVEEWVRCSRCGTYSSPGTKFCDTCHAQIMA
jgi:hypothetical protein